MKIRGTGFVVLAFCLVGGLIAAIFTPAIAASLTPPAAPHGRAVTTARMQPTSTPPPITMLQPAPTSGVTVLAQDTFQRPDQPFWGISSDHRTWGSDANTNQAFAIVNHAGQITGGQGALQATLNVTNPDADVLVNGTVSQFDANGDTNLGIVLRWQDTNNWYKALINGTELQLLKDVNGAISVLGQQAFTATSGTAYSLRFSALGSNLFAKAWPGAQPEPAAWSLMEIDTQLTTGVSGVRVKITTGVIIRVTTFLETSVANPM